LKYKNQVAGLFIAFIFCLSFSVDYISYQVGVDHFIELPQMGIKRVILISVDSCNPDYIRPDIMPNLYNFMFYTGCMFINAETILSSDTVSGHTSMLCGAYPNTTKIIGNQYTNVSMWYHPFAGFLAPYKFFNYNIRQAKTIIEALEYDRSQGDRIGTHFISSKWLHWMLAWESDTIVGPEYKLSFPLGLSKQYLPFSSHAWFNPKYQSQVGNGYGETLPMDNWIMNALIESLRNEVFLQNFYFVNIGYTDEMGHVYGARNAVSDRQMREVDNLLHRLFMELISLGKLFTTTICIVSDHGMQTITSSEINLEEYLYKAGIPCYVHLEGGTAYIGLLDKSQKNYTLEFLNLINSRYWLFDRIIPSENYSTYHLPEDGTAGDICVSARVGSRFRISAAPVNMNGEHGGIFEQKIIMLWLGQGVKHRGIITNKDPVSIVDVVPTIGNITGWDISQCSLDGRVLTEILEA